LAWYHAPTDVALDLIVGFVFLVCIGSFFYCFLNSNLVTFSFLGLTFALFLFSSIIILGRTNRANPIGFFNLHSIIFTWNWIKSQKQQQMVW